MWRYLWLTPIYLFSTSLPLLSEIGANLEYEYTVLSSIFALLLIPAYGFFLPARYIPHKPQGYRPSTSFDILWIFFLSPLIALLPALYVYASGMCPCSGMGFSFWMGVQWYPAWILAHGVMHVIIRLRCESHSMRRILAAWIGIGLALIASAAISFWFNPQARLVSLIGGFIHGPIYDDWIPVDHGLILARLSHLLIACLLLSYAWYRKNKTHKGIAYALGGLWLIFSLWAGTYPSIRSGMSALTEQLPGTIKGGGITLHFKPRGKSMKPSKRIKRLYLDSLFHYSELKKILKDAPSNIHVFVYPNRESKKKWFGGGSTDITDVHTPSIHITEGAWPHYTLRHELVHAVASDFGYYGLGFHPNIAFTEGLAVALAPQERTMTLDEGSGSLFHSNRLPPIKTLFSPFFWQESGRRAYTVAGSLINFLVEKYGIDSVKKLYSGDSWEDAFKTSQREILYNWKKQVTESYDHEKHGIYSEALYRYQGVYKDVCPHSKSDLTQIARDNTYIRVRQPINWNPENDYWLWRIKMDPKNKLARLQMWREEIGRIAKSRTISEGRLITWQQTIHNARIWPPKTLEDVDLAILEADILRVTGTMEESTEILLQVQQYAKKNWVGDSLVRKIDSRLAVDKELSPQAGLQWRRYLAGWRQKIPEMSPSDPWISVYLRLRNDKKKSLDKRFRGQLATAKIPKNIASTFVVEWYKHLGRNLMMAELFPDAVEAYEAAAKAAPDSSKKILIEHARRADFYSKNWKD